MLVHPESEPVNTVALEAHRGTHLDEIELDEVLVLVGRVRFHLAGRFDAYTAFDLDRLAYFLPVCREPLKRVRAALSTPDPFAGDDLDAILRVAYRAAGVFVAI
jgi:hypothetical protein